MHFSPDVHNVAFSHFRATTDCYALGSPSPLNRHTHNARGTLSNIDDDSIMMQGRDRRDINHNEAQSAAAIRSVTVRYSDTDLTASSQSNSEHSSTS